jgi:hypothetical protein
VNNDYPFIGNAGNTGNSDQSGNPAKSYISAFQPNGNFPNQGNYYQGMEQAFMSPERPMLPAVQADVFPGSAPAKTGLGSLLNMKQITSFVDRMGGIEGIIGTITKVQSFMSQFSQFAPMIKMLWGSFSGGAAKGAIQSTGGGTVKPKKRGKATVKKSVKKSAPVKRRRR